MYRASFNQWMGLARHIQPVGGSIALVSVHLLLEEDCVTAPTIVGNISMGRNVFRKSFLTVYCQCRGNGN